MRSLKPLLVTLFMVCCSQFADANTGEKGNKKLSDGYVHGYILDAYTRKPIAGVTISLSSRKIQGEKEIQSDASGYFNFGKLPAGDLSIMFEKKGYKLYKRDVLSLKEGTTVKLSVEVHADDGADGSNDIWHPLFKLLNDE